MKLDTTRVDNVIFEAEERVKKIKNFVADKKKRLEFYANNIEEFAKACNCVCVELGNMYSSGGVINPDYTDECSLIVNVTMQICQGVKNIDLFKRKLVKNWKNYMLGSNIQLGDSYNIIIKNSEVRFRIFV